MSRSPAEISALVRVGRAGFFLTMIISLIMATLPHPPPIPGEPSDKVMHMLAFATLGTLAAFAFPRRSIALLFVGLTLFGAMIELIQLVPMLNRDSELADLLADMAAGLASLVGMRALMAWHMRRRQGPERLPD